MWPYIQAVAGLVILFVAGDILVRGAVSLAARFKVSPLMIGLTVVAFGTSAPELVVGVQAALTDVPTLSLGNVVGSNIANVLLVLGLPALIQRVSCDQHDFRYNLHHMMFATALIILLCSFGALERWMGIVLVLLLGAFILLSFRWSRKSPYSPEEYADVEGVPAKPYSVPVAAGLTLAGLIGLALGANLLVEGSSAIARAFGVSEDIIGLTLVAVGTSLPELVTSFLAALHRHGDVAVGNVLGSNIFNLYGIMGVTSIVAPVPVPASFMIYDLWVMAAAALMLGIFIWRRSSIGATWGLVFLASYGLYLWGLVAEVGRA